MNRLEIVGPPQKNSLDLLLVALKDILEILYINELWCFFREDIVDWLLRVGPRVKVVHLGSATHVSDLTFKLVTEAGLGYRFGVEILLDPQRIDTRVVLQY